MLVYVIRLHDKWVDTKKQWSTFWVQDFSLTWRSTVVGDCDSRQCSSSNMTLKISVLNNDNTVKTIMRTCQVEDMDSAEVAAMVVVAVVVMVPTVEETGINQPVVRMTVAAMTMKALENRRRCLNHTALGNTR